MYGIDNVMLVVIVLAVIFLLLSSVTASGLLLVIGVIALFKGHLLGGIVCIVIGFAIKPRRY
jgi:hypothetical protein